MYTRGCSKAGNVNTTLTYQLQSGRVPGPGPGAKFGRALNYMLSRIVHVYQCTSYNELVRLGIFGSLVLWISLSSLNQSDSFLSDLLYKLNCHVEK